MTPRQPKWMIRDPSGRIHPWYSGDFHSSFGVLRASDVKPGKRLTNLKYVMEVFSPTFRDLLRFIHRTAAIPSPKDIGLILAYTGIGKDSTVVDAGTGCGVLAAYLARICRKVVTYEIRKEFADNAKKNFKALNVSPILRHLDISKGIRERNVDLITLDLPEPWRVLAHAKRALKSGGFLVCYLPSMVQVQNLVEVSKRHCFFVERVSESIERPWIVEDRIVRPEHHALTHSAFLVFLRRV